MICFDATRTNLGRIRFLQCFLFVLFIILAITIFYRQYLEFYRYNQLNERQCLRRILYPGLRGSIYDRHGHVLATHRDSYCLYLDLNHFRGPFERFCKKNKDTVAQQEQLLALVHDTLLPYAQQLGPIPFHVSAKTLYRHYRQNILLPLQVAQDLPQELYAKLLNLLPKNGPFSVQVEKIRFYPYGSSACHVIGYVSKIKDLDDKNLPGNDLRTFFLSKEKGRTGIEAFYDEQLRGHNGGDIWRVNPAGQEQSCLLSIPSVTGENITLSLDIELQQICEKALGNSKGSVSIVEIETGDVLALASKPDFNLNELMPFITKATFAKITEQGAWLNRAIQGLYPPGSTFKLISFSAMLRAGIIDVHSRYCCTGSYKIGDRLFRCHKHSGHGLIDTIQAIQMSCNPFIFKYGLQMKAETLYNEACFYYLNVPTGIDLPYETQKFCIPSPSWKKERLKEGWSSGDTANMLIGQGYLLLTPLKMACFAAALAKNHNIFIPHLCQKKDWSFSTALPKTAWETVIKGMSQVGSHYIKGIPTAIKTGTAQIKTAGENSYTHIGWMIGFAPINDPKIAFCIELEQEGTGDGFWGGQTCAPIAEQFLHNYFKK